MVRLKPNIKLKIKIKIVTIKPNFKPSKKPFLFDFLPKKKPPTPKENRGMIILKIDRYLEFIMSK